MPSLTNHRLGWARWLLVLAFLAIAWQLHDIQVGRGVIYAAQARQMRTVEVFLEEYARGQITDRSGIPLGGEHQANRVVVFPQLMEDPQRDLTTLARILGRQPNLLLNKATNGAFIIPEPPDAARRRALQNAGLPGVFLLPVTLRYGNDPLAVHVTGHLGKINSRDQLARLRADSGKHYELDDWVGKAGLEYFYETRLKGQHPLRRAYLALDAKGRIVKGPGLVVENNGSDPSRRNVRTTIDYNVQRVVEEVMGRHIRRGAVVVMRAGSGDILAMASRPGYHPEPRVLEQTIAAPADEIFLDRSTALFQPGSIFKMVLAAAAIENGLVDGDTMLHCSGAAARPIHCWHEAGHGDISFADAFAHSCNPAFVELGRMLGADTIIRYATALGLADQTVAGYPVPQSGQQNLQLIGQDYNLANSSIGQGPVLVTPVQVAALVNTVASDGIFYTPRLVTGLTGANDHIIEYIDTPEPHRVLEPATARALQEMLRRAVTEGAGRMADLPGPGSAGKTGSAEVAGPESSVNAWFAGYAPADNPRYVVVVLVQDGTSGGETAAPVFRAITERLLNGNG